MKIRTCLDCRSQYDKEVTKDCPYMKQHITIKRAKIAEKNAKRHEGDFGFKDRLGGECNK